MLSMHSSTKTAVHASSRRTMHTPSLISLMIMAMTMAMMMMMMMMAMMMMMTMMVIVKTIVVEAASAVTAGMANYQI